MVNKTFFSFIITYERTQYLQNTINSILNQSIQPQRIYVIDNSLSSNIVELVKQFQFNFGIDIIFHKIGFNTGPAGASNFALQKMSKEGAEWIYWGDDDDPPTDPKTFERLLEIAMEYPNSGVVGKVGGKFFPNEARTRVFENSELLPIVEADYVTGGKQMIISAQVVKAGILPDSKLFFGFEELEFCLRVKDAGFSILVDGQGMIEGRSSAGNLDENYRWKGKSIGDISRINRQYYSVRNMLFILWSRKHYFGYLFFLSKSLVKIPFSIRYGLDYFLKFSKLTLTAIYHQWIGRYGQFISTR